MHAIHEKRERLFNVYYESLKPLTERELIRLPHTTSNQNRSKSDFFYIILRDEEIRTKLIYCLKERSILAVFHYVPLHLSAIGRSIGYKEGDLPVTESISKRILRLPLYYDMTIDELQRVIDAIFDFFSSTNY
jgi:dTDP-4-amino-4,6-dideoxygalactose transaminase